MNDLPTLPWRYRRVRKRRNLGLAALAEQFEARSLTAEWKQSETLTRGVSLDATLFEELDEFRQLQENVMLQRVNRPFHSLAVCKANAGEGSSRIASHLAVAFAQDPRARIALIDADLRHPSLHRLLHVSREDGLYETLMEGAASAKDRLKATMLPNLSVMTSGDPIVSRVLPFAAADFADILQVLTTQFSMVIVDTPPILADATASVLASQCDGTLLVTRSEQTRWEVAQEAQARLRTAGAHVIGAVLNQRKYPIPDFLYKRL